MESALYAFYSLLVSNNKTHSLAKPRLFVLLYFSTREYKPFARTFHDVFSIFVADLIWKLNSLKTVTCINFMLFIVN